MKLIDAVFTVARAKEIIRNTDIEFDPDAMAFSHTSLKKSQIESVSMFLCGKTQIPADYKPDNLPDECSGLINGLGLAGNDIKFLGAGANAIAFGNDKIVFRLENMDSDHQNIDIDFNAIPDGLATKILASGTFNGVNYTATERLKNRLDMPIEDIMGFLFKAHEQGFVYDHPQIANFGYSKDGALKAIDHEHFHRLDQNKSNFKASLEELPAYIEFEDTKFPVVARSDTRTYVVLDSNTAETTDVQSMKKKVEERLKTVGFTANNTAITVMDDVPVISIDATDVMLGNPPKSTSVADILRESLAKDNKPTEYPNPVNRTRGSKF